MTKMRTFTFYDGDKTETKEAVSYKKAVRSYQSGSESSSVKVEWEAKKGGRRSLRNDTGITNRQKNKTSGTFRKEKSGFKSKNGKITCEKIYKVWTDYKCYGTY